GPRAKPSFASWGRKAFRGKRPVSLSRFPVRAFPGWVRDLCPEGLSPRGRVGPRRPTVIGLACPGGTGSVGRGRGMDRRVDRCGWFDLVLEKPARRIRGRRRHPHRGPRGATGG